MEASLQKIVGKPRLLFRPDAVLGWSLTPDHGVRVRYRPDVVQTIAADGWRYVPGATASCGPRLAVYGCSFTYGTGLTDNEGFVARLQGAVRNGRLLNRGIGGQSTVQNYLQFRRDLAAGAIDAAIFAIFSDHRYRNIAHPKRMRQFLSPEWYRLGVEHVPVLRQNRDAPHQIIYLPIWQPSLQRGGFDAFLPDQPMIDAATLSILAEVRTLALSQAIPVRFALLDRLDPGFNRLVMSRFDDTVDVSIPLDADHSFRPHDWHPNAKGNQIYADGLLAAAEDLIDRARGSGHG